MSKWQPATRCKLERVRRHLDDDVSDTRFDELGEPSLQVRRLRRRVGAGERADHAGRAARTPAGSSAIRLVVVVLPLVPVTPTIVKLRLG